MKFAAIVLRNIKNSINSVCFSAVADGLLSGGVYLEETAILPYDQHALFTATLTRMRYEYQGIAVICDEALIPYTREVVAATFGSFTGDYLYEDERNLVAVLPANARGRELALAQVVPLFDGRRKMRFSRMIVKTIGAPPEQIRTAVAAAEAVSGDTISYNVYEKFGDARIEAIYHSQTPKMIADDVLRILVTQLEQYVYAMEDTSIAQRLFDALKLHRLQVATAESFTAGNVGRSIVEIPGASAVFYEGLNTYANGSKESRVGVSPYTLKAHGAVSDEVAYEMAAGLIKDGHCDLAIATTGFAGPKTDGMNKPVGLCYIAIGTKERVKVYKLQLDGDRERITQTAVNLALFYAYKEIK